MKGGKYVARNILLIFSKTVEILCSSYHLEMTHAESHMFVCMQSHCGREDVGRNPREAKGVRPQPRRTRPTANSGTPQRDDRNPQSRAEQSRGEERKNERTWVVWRSRPLSSPLLSSPLDSHSIFPFNITQGSSRRLRDFHCSIFINLVSEKTLATALYHIPERERRTRPLGKKCAPDRMRLPILIWNG